MNLQDLIENWDDVKQQKKYQALQKVYDFLNCQDGDHDQILYSLLLCARDFEDADYFGTEGLMI